MSDAQQRLSLEVAVKAARRPGDWAEFGVSVGVSARLLLSRLPEGRTLWLFDSFEGLPRAWGQRQRGAFACPVPDFQDERARLIIGRFEETVQGWANAYPEPLGLVHIDCDLYESTRAVLEGLRGLIVAGTVVAFDEFTDFGGEEQRAWQEQGYQAEEISRLGGKVVFRVLSLSPNPL